MRCWALVSGLAFSLWALPTRAAEASCELGATECGRLAFEAGVQAFENKRWGEASKLFRRSLKLRAHPVILFNLALSEVALKDYDAGIFHLRQVRADERTDATLKQRCEEQLALALRNAAEIRLDSSMVPEATLRVNGRASNARGVFYAAPGTASVSVEREGMSPVARRLRLRAGEKRELVLLEEMSSSSAASPAREGSSSTAMHISFGVGLALGGATTMSAVTSHKLDARTLILGGGALVATGTGMVLWLSRSPDGQAQALTFDPIERKLQYVTRF
ncbi:MAG: hypothetical protein SFV15_12190 [Polyangiaceae bacterium]|nr:hypothetical protein [Polyangiaceae bacterium]